MNRRALGFFIGISIVAGCSGFSLALCGYLLAVFGGAR
jgi:hypothetical protein